VHGKLPVPFTVGVGQDAAGNLAANAVGQELGENPFSGSIGGIWQMSCYANEL